MSTEERFANWQEQDKQKPNKNIERLYLSSILLNFLPVIVQFLRLKVDVHTHGEDYLSVFYFVSLLIIASIINLSFFLLKIKSVRNSKIMNFFACYASSLFFLGIFVFAMYSWFDVVIWKWILFYCGSNFIINFLLVFIYRNIIKPHGK